MILPENRYSILSDLMGDLELSLEAKIAETAYLQSARRKIRE